MNKNNKYTNRCQDRQFTLVELMTVIVIIAVILGITIPAFNTFLGRSAVDSAASMVAAELRIARAQAAQRRTQVGVAFFKDGAEKGVAFQAFYKDNADDKYYFLPGSKKEFLPKGVLVLLPGMSAMSNSAFESEDESVLTDSTLEIYAGKTSTTSDDCFCVLFKKNGSPDTTDITVPVTVPPTIKNYEIRIYEAVMNEAATKVIALNKKSWTTLTLNNYTGMVTITKE